MTDEEVWVRAYCAVLPAVAHVADDVRNTDALGFAQDVSVDAKLHALQAVRAFRECFPRIVPSVPADAELDRLAKMSDAEVDAELVAMGVNPAQLKRSLEAFLSAYAARVRKP